MTARQAFKLGELRAAGSLMCGHDEAWLDEWRTHERRETIARIRKAIKARDVTMQVTRDELLEILEKVEG